MEILKLYHYTNIRNVDSIKQKGLLNIFGLIFFTTDDENEPSVNFVPMIEMAQVSVEITDEYEKVSDLLRSDYDLMAQFFNPTMIGIISNPDKWYVTRIKTIEPNKLTIKVKENGKWKKV
jgi:hypothetical protein